MFLIVDARQTTRDNKYSQGLTRVQLLHITGEVNELDIIVVVVVNRVV